MVTRSLIFGLQYLNYKPVLLFLFWKSSIHFCRVEKKLFIKILWSFMCNFVFDSENCVQKMVILKFWNLQNKNFQSLILLFLSSIVKLQTSTSVPPLDKLDTFLDNEKVIYRVSLCATCIDSHLIDKLMNFSRFKILGDRVIIFILFFRSLTIGQPLFIIVVPCRGGTKTLWPYVW